MHTTGELDPFLDAFRLQQAELNDTAHWLGNIQHNAIDKVKSQGLPTMRNKDWRYTDIQAIRQTPYQGAQEVPQLSVTPEELNQLDFADLDCYRLVFVNARLNNALSTCELLKDGLLIKDLDLALRDNPDQLQAYFAEEALPNYTFATLNTAFLKYGSFIVIPDKLVLDKPIHLIYINVGNTKPIAIHPRNLVVIGRQAKACVIERYIALDQNANYLNNVVTELVVHPEARLTHYRFQQESDKSQHIGHLFIKQYQDSHLSSHTFMLGSALARTDVHCQLHEPGASVDMNGLYIVDGERHVDNHIRADHLAPHTHSTENYRGILTDQGCGVFNGKVVVHKHAQKIEAHQDNANLLLSSHATINTKPELEIYADDVKCSHGATIGRLDEDMQFYLRTRGIDEESAKKLLIFAFAKQVLDLIKSPPIRHQLEALILDQLSRHNTHLTRKSAP